MGVPTPEKTDRNKEILRLHIEGMSYSQLARKYNLTSQRIYAILRRERERNSEE